MGMLRGDSYPFIPRIPLSPASLYSASCPTPLPLYPVAPEDFL